MTTQLQAVHHGGGLGGAPVSLLKLLSNLDRREFEPSAIFTEPGDAPKYAATLGIPINVVPTGGAFFYSAHARLGPRAVARFVKTFPGAVRRASTSLRQQRFDLLHLNTSVLVAWAAAARRERVPVVWVVREVLGPNPWLRRWHASFILSHARRVVAISDAVAECFPAPVDVVHNAVDLTDFRIDLLDQSAQVRAELHIPRDANVVMAIGTVQRPKGHWLLLDAFARLPESTHLVLVTGGASSDYVRTLRGRAKRLMQVRIDNLDALMREVRRLGLARRVHVTGFRTDVARVLAAADVLAFPSLEPEGFGRPIIEAMALARPVVATDVGPSAEILGPDAGRLVRPNADQLAAALDALLASPKERARLGRAGRARVEACFGLDRQVAEMSAVYRAALQPRRG